MKRILLAVILTAAASSAMASEFCAGFEIGYKTVAGNMSITPICPIEPITPIGSTPYQEGLKAGMEEASN